MFISLAFSEKALETLDSESRRLTVPGVNDFLQKPPRLVVDHGSRGVPDPGFSMGGKSTAPIISLSDSRIESQGDPNFSTLEYSRSPPTLLWRGEAGVRRQMTTRILARISDNK